MFIFSLNQAKPQIQNHNCKILSATCNAKYCNITQAERTTLVWQWHLDLLTDMAQTKKHKKLITYKEMSIYNVKTL